MFFYGLGEGSGGDSDDDDDDDDDDDVDVDVVVVDDDDDDVDVDVVVVVVVVVELHESGGCRCEHEECVRWWWWVCCSRVAKKLLAIGLPLPANVDPKQAVTSKSTMVLDFQYLSAGSCWNNNLNWSFQPWNLYKYEIPG